MTGPTVQRRYDVIIVGAGMSGSLLAKRLGDQGWQVLVLEAGNGGTETWQGYQDSVDTFRGTVAKVPNSAYRANAAAPSPNVLDLEAVPGGYVSHGYFVQNGKLPYGTDYLRALGGTAMHWMGVAIRMLPEDFHTRRDFGYGRDWPIGYQDLLPYYEAAEHEIGTSGDADELRELDGHQTPADYAYPMHRIPPSYLDDRLRVLDGTPVRDPVVGRSYPLTMHTVPQARNSTPDPAHRAPGEPAGYRPDGAVGLANYGERCVGNSSCTPICPVQAKWTPLRVLATLGRNVTVATRCVVTRVLAGADGLARGVEYRTYGDPASPVSEVHTVEADVVILAAHSIENARLLLVSGLANRSGQVGRNLMDHPTMLTWALAPDSLGLGGQLGPFRGPGHTSGWEVFRSGTGRSDRSPFRIEIGNWGWGWSTFAPMSNVARMLRLGGDPATGEVLPEKIFGVRLRWELGDKIGRQLQLQFAVEQPADPDNRMTIDPRYLGPLGSPRPVLTYDLSTHVKTGMVAAKAVSRAIYKALKAVDYTDHRGPADQPPPLGYFRFRGEDFAFRGAGHGAGTHVMGERATSVVDSYQRCWDHRNLYAVGCGSMPSVGTSNPSLTMMALALRSAEQIHRDLVELHRPANLGDSAPKRPRSSTPDRGKVKTGTEVSA